MLAWTMIISNVLGYIGFLFKFLGFVSYLRKDVRRKHLPSFLSLEVLERLSQARNRKAWPALSYILTEDHGPQQEVERQITHFQGWDTVEHPGIPAVEEFVSLVCRVCACFGGIVEVLLINSASSGQIGSPVKLQSGSHCMKHMQLSESVKHVAFLEVLNKIQRSWVTRRRFYLFLWVFSWMLHTKCLQYPRRTEEGMGFSLRLELQTAVSCHVDVRNWPWRDIVLLCTTAWGHIQMLGRQGNRTVWTLYDNGTQSLS